MAPRPAGLASPGLAVELASTAGALNRRQRTHNHSCRREERAEQYSDKKIQHPGSSGNSDAIIRIPSACNQGASQTVEREAGCVAHHDGVGLLVQTVSGGLAALLEGVEGN
jgi:hypothetical protein